MYMVTRPCNSNRHGTFLLWIRRIRAATLDDAAIVTPIESIIEIFALAAVPVACVQGNWIAAVTPILIYLAALCIVPVVFKWWHKHPGKAWDESKL